MEGVRRGDFVQCPVCHTKLRIPALKEDQKDVTEPADISTYESPIYPSHIKKLIDILKRQNFRVGDYQLKEIIARGGMSVVFKGLQLKLNRPIAIKAMYTLYCEKKDFRELFRNEVSLLSRLRHPNIVSIIDIIEADGCPLIVTEYIEGESLREIISQRSLGINELISIITQIRNGLSYIHSQGVIHGDMKPANILITPVGDVKIVDFGIARRFLDAVGISTDFWEKYVIGTPRYMAPEVRESLRNASFASDIYSLGITFYEILTREKFSRKNYRPPSEINLTLSRAVDAVIEKATCLEPSKRYQHVADFCQDLIDALTGRITGKSVVNSVRSIPYRKGYLVAGIIVILILLGSLFTNYILIRSEKPKVPIKKTFSPTPALSKSLRPSAKSPPEPANVAVPLPSNSANHLLITEINVYKPEFIEILNPTNRPIKLTNYYLSDAIYDNGDYYLLPSGKRIKGGEFYDFVARFPPGAVINPGECQTVAINGSRVFTEHFGISPTYELVEDDTEPDAVPNMLEVYPGSIDPASSISNA
ncbi:MAG: protein kinase, partial [Armatimonadetes bacterium]|nr:protein kinase [Armatimonadota bacterium]